MDWGNWALVFEFLDFFDWLEINFEMFWDFLWNCLIFDCSSSAAESSRNPQNETTWKEIHLPSEWLEFIEKKNTLLSNRENINSSNLLINSSRSYWVAKVEKLMQFGERKCNKELLFIFIFVFELKRKKNNHKSEENWIVN
jgi:hypothetical protein